MIATTPLIVDDRPRCWRCNRELGVSLTRPWRIDCPRCRAINKRLADDDTNS